jgi:two-component system response regulator AlgR
VLRVLIVDDEPPARERLGQLLAEIPGAELIGQAATGAEALELAARLAPDVVLLDVRMPGLDGIETARHLGVLEEPPAVIFTTAYDQYAVNAFETRAVGYLLKPVRRDKLAAALAQADRLTRPQLQRLAAAAGAPRRTHIAVRRREQVRVIPLEDILYFQADQKYTTVRHTQGEDLIEEPLRVLEEELGERVVRIHRNTLINATHVQGIERDEEGRYCVRLRGCAAALPVSRRLAGELLERFRV